MGDYQLGGGRGRIGEKVQGLRPIIGRYKIDGGRVRTVWEVEKPKNGYARPRDLNWRGDCWREGRYQVSGARGNWDNCGSIISTL